MARWASWRQHFSKISEETGKTKLVAETSRLQMNEIEQMGIKKRILGW